MIGIDFIASAAMGLIGSIVTGVTNYAMQKSKNKHDLEMIRAKTDAMIAEANANIQITKAEVEGKVDLSDAKAYIESQKQGGQRLFESRWLATLWRGGLVSRFFAGFIAVLFGWVDILKAMIRPGITIYLMVVSTWVTCLAWSIMQRADIVISSDQAVAIFNEMMLMVKYLTVSCVTWYVADRRVAKFLMRLK